MTNTAGIPGDRICSFIERVERIDEEIKALNEGKKEVFVEATYADDAAEVVKKLGLKNSIHIGIRREGVRWRDMWRGMARARSPKRSSSAPFLRPS